jgi:asparagine synthetase B (glutamine-hydrolysing)
MPDQSDQPYSSDDDKVHLVFNGELYNFNIIRSELSEAGSRFFTEGDTEVFLRLYEKYGNDFVKRREIDSLFSIAIHDENRNKLIITRDWPGRVPLFYYYNAEQRIFVFSSELKGLRALSWVPMDEPIELTPGDILTLDIASFELHVEAYFRPKPVKTTKPLLEVGADLHRILDKSAKHRTMGDVPICTMLSGGIDSLMTTYYVFSNIDFNNQSYTPKSYVFAVENAVSEDVRRARIAAKGFQDLGLQLREIRVSAESLVVDMPDIVQMFETRQIKALSVYPLPIYYYLAPVMRDDGFKVTIGGHGVDELLGAYTSWKELNKPHKVQMNVKSRLAFMAAIYDNMLRRASIIFMNRGPIEARFPFLCVDVCEYMLGIDSKWLQLTAETGEILLTLIEERAGPRSMWTEQLVTIYDYLVGYLDNNGVHLDGADMFLQTEIEKLFWKLPLIVAGMYAVSESFLPFHLLFNAKLRGQHGAGITDLEPMIVDRYSSYGATDGEIYQQFVREAYSL